MAQQWVKVFWRKPTADLSAVVPTYQEGLDIKPTGKAEYSHLPSPTCWRSVGGATMIKTVVFFGIALPPLPPPLPSDEFVVLTWTAVCSPLQVPAASASFFPGSWLSVGSHCALPKRLRRRKLNVSCNILRPGTYCVRVTAHSSHRTTARSKDLNPVKFIKGRLRTTWGRPREAPPLSFTSALQLSVSVSHVLSGPFPSLKSIHWHVSRLMLWGVEYSSVKKKHSKLRLANQVLSSLFTKPKIPHGVNAKRMAAAAAASGQDLPLRAGWSISDRRNAAKRASRNLHSHCSPAWPITAARTGKSDCWATDETFSQWRTGLQHANSLTPSIASAE